MPTRIFLIGIGRFLTLYQAIRRFFVLVSATITLTVSCAGSSSDSHQCRLNEQVWIEVKQGNGLSGDRFTIVAVSPQYDEPIELGQFSGSTNATYVETGLYGSSLRAVIYRNDPPFAVSWEDETGAVDPVVCTLGQYLIVGLVDDGTARMQLDGVEATRPVASGEGLLVGPAVVFVSGP